MTKALRKIETLTLSALMSFVKDHAIPDTVEIIWEDRDHKHYNLMYYVVTGFQYVQMNPDPGEIPSPPVTVQDRHLIVVYGRAVHDFF